MAVPGNESWTRKYPPMAGALASFLLVMLVLPSALKLPQTDPPQTLEFAPVPPDDEDNPPPDQSGSIGSLGLGSSSTSPGGGPDQPEDINVPPPPPPPGQGLVPTGKRCVGSPPRQTEDPLSPPCVAYFDGDNGGATYKGVTGSEIRVLLYVDGDEGTTYSTSRGQETAPPNGIYDVEGDESDHYWIRIGRTLGKYLNDRYQFYGRRMHVYVQYGGEFGSGPERRAADGATALEADPFAVIDASTTARQAYIDPIADDGRVVFYISGEDTITAGADEAFFRQHPGQIWGYNPTIQKLSHAMVDYACTVVVPSPVSYSGIPAHMGGERVFGALVRDDPVLAPDYELYGQLNIQGIEDCGGNIVETGATTNHCWSQEFRPCPEVALDTMARFQAAGVTTILWVGDESDVNMQDAANSLGYYPEWLLFGAGSDKSSSPSNGSTRDVWEHTRTLTTYPLMTSELEDRHCERAFREGDPEFPTRDARFWGCSLYNTFHQLAIGLQVAGPTLTPASMDRGFHAIPAIDSPDPTVPACFYLPGDYTCVKDIAVAWWDNAGRTPGARYDNGCYRAMGGGERFAPGNWPDTNVDDRKSPDDPCNLHGLPEVTDF